MIKSLNTVQVSRSALAHNCRLCLQQARGAEVMAMVKADAYGHGMVECARVFAENGASAFGVAETVEGVQLRQAGFVQPIFILAGILPEFFAALFDYELTPVLVDGSMTNRLGKEAVLRNTEIGVHLKVDAGMGRQGSLFADIPDLVAEITQTEGVRLEGIMAHFPMADDPACGNSEVVLSGFLQVVQALPAQIRQDLCLHIANSPGLFLVKGAALDMVRPGISLYGYSADGRIGKVDSIGGRLMPAMSFSSRVIQVREVPAGTGLGYSHIYTTGRKTRLAVLPVGYEDGYSRSLSNRAQVLLHGKRAALVGRVSMNLTLVDVTDIEGVQPGDEAVLLGRQGQETITANDIGRWSDTINYEVLCLLGHCNDIQYLE